MAKGVPIVKKTRSLTENLFIGSHKTSQRERLTDNNESNDNLKDYELMKLRILQEEMERRIKKYENTIDFYQYSLVLIIVLLMIKMIVDGSKK